jgi:hypothetical protein
VSNSFKFLEDPHVGLLTFTETVTQEILHSLLEEPLAGLDRCTSPYYMVVDATQKSVFNFNAITSPHVSQIIKHQNFGWAVIAGSHPLIRFWASLLARSLGMKFKAFEKLEDALAFVETMRRSEKEQPAQV